MKFGAPNIPLDNEIPPDQGWGIKILRLIKIVIDSLSVILNRGVSINEHIRGGQIVVPVIAGTYPVYFKPATRTVGSVWIGKVVEKLDSTTPPTAGVWCDWEHVGGRVKISKITGLSAGASYDITFVYFGD